MWRPNPTWRSRSAKAASYCVRRGRRSSTSERHASEQVNPLEQLVGQTQQLGVVGGNVSGCERRACMLADRVAVFAEQHREQADAAQFVFGSLHAPLEGEPRGIVALSVSLDDDKRLASLAPV